MTAADLTREIQRLVAKSRDAGMSDEAIIDVLLENVEALREGLS
jgi:hypothetical protein